MIPYPGVELALKRAGGDRVRARGLIRESIIAEADRQAAIAGRSLNCESDKHADADYGCRNDGTGCICSCHDGAKP